jgi:hypothetical protein
VYHQLNVYQVLEVVGRVQIVLLYVIVFEDGLAVVHQFELNDVIYCLGALQFTISVHAQLQLQV